MTLPQVIRIFFAIDLPPNIKVALDDYMLILKKKAKTNSIRWTRKENLHITLQFLGKVATDDVSKLLVAVRERMKFLAPIEEVEVGAIQLFPSPFKPRVIVFEILPAPELKQLAQLIGEAIVEQGYEIDTKPFRAHLTLARIKHMHSVNLSFLNEVPPLSITHIPLPEITLFRSEPHPLGSRYTIIDKIEIYSSVHYD